MKTELNAGDKPPSKVNVVIEIPEGSSVKYEVDNDTGAVFVDRFLYSATHYPFNYGFIPQTSEKDGDPVDVIVMSQHSVYPMVVIRSRPIGMLLTEDEKGEDAKIVATPIAEIDPYYAAMENVGQIPQFTKNQIEHFFEQYKELEPNKFVKIVGWKDREDAYRRIRSAMKRYDAAKPKSTRG
ncbi:MAG: inorganic diphosphatase [Nitrososphaerales archaeon]